MAKILLQGTDKQIQNLKDLLAGGTLPFSSEDLSEEEYKEYLRQVLPTEASQYCIDNLLQIADVQGTFEATDSQAETVLIKALNSGWLVEQTFAIISDEAEELGLKKKQDDSESNQ